MPARETRPREAESRTPASPPAARDQIRSGRHWRRAGVVVAWAWLAAAFATQLGGRAVGWLYAHPGDPPLAEVLQAMPPDSPALLQVDLRAAPRAPLRPTTRRLPTPPDWQERQPFLIAFVDGQRVAFTRRRPMEAAPAPRTFYVPVSGRRAELAVDCPSGPCRSAVLVREGPALRRAIAKLRAPGRPGAVGAVLVLWAVFVAVLGAARGHWTGRGWFTASAFAALILAWWAYEGVARNPWLADPVLVYELVFAALAVAGARWGVERWGPVVAAVAAGTLLVPLALTDRTYLTDWTNHLYYAARQADSLRELLRPSYFLHSDVTGAFYPYYAFYGGTAYVATAALGVLTGSSVLAYRASYAAGMLAAYAGAAWLARQAGLGSWRAHLPALVLVSTAYYLTNAYGRGAWGEFLATSAIPLLIAAALSRLRGEGRRGSALALLAATVAFSGSHTITLAWGGLFLVLVSAVGLVSLRATPGLRRMIGVGSLLAAGVAINAWFLLPLAAFGPATDIARASGAAFGTHDLALAHPGVWLHPGRSIPPEVGAGLYVQLPVYALLWAAAASAARFRLLAPPWRRLCAGLWGLLAFFLWLITSDRLDAVWVWAPAVLKAVQFQFRLHSYAILAAAGLVLVGLRAVAGSTHARRWQAGLVGAVCVQLALAQYQVWSAARFVPLASIASAGTQAPRSLQAPQDYRFTGPPREGERVLEVHRRLHLEPAAVRGERGVILAAEESEPGLAVLNVPHSPFVRLEGDGRIAGRTADGWTVVALDAAPDERPRRLEIVATLPGPARVGVAISLAALLLGVLLVLRPPGSLRRPEP